MTEDLRVRATRSSVWTLAAQVFQTLVGAGSFALMASQLGPKDYGLYGMATSAVGLVGTVGDAGMVAAVVRQPVIDDEIESTAWWISIASGIGLFFLAALAAPLLSLFYKEPRVLPLAIGCAGVFLLNAPGYVSKAKLSKRMQFHKLGLLGTCGSVLGAAVGYVAAKKGAGPWSLIALSLTGLFVQTVLLILWAPPTIRRSFFSRNRARELAAFGSQISTFSIAIVLGRSADAFLVGHYLGDVPLGLLTSSMALVSIPVTRVSTSIASVFLPAILELPEGEEQGRAMSAVLQTMFMVLAPTCLGIFAVAHELTAAFPNRWGPIAPALEVVSLGLLLDPIGWLSFTILQAHGRARALARVAIAMIPFSWAGAFLGVHLGRVTAVLALWAVVNTSGGLVMLLLCWRSLRLGPWFLSKAAIPLAGAFAMAAIVRATLHVTHLAGTRAGLPTGIVVGGLAYSLYALAVMREPSQKILRLLGRSFGRKAPVA